MPQITKPLNSRSASGIWHDQNRQAIAAHRIVPSADIIPSQSTTGVALHFAQPRKGGGGASVTQYRLKEFDADDYFVCRALTAHAAWDPDADPGDPEYDDKSQRFDEGETDIYIAKPYHLRKSEFDGLTVEVEVETFAGLSNPPAVATRMLQFTYMSATYRRAMDVTTTPQPFEFQIIIPRFAPDDDIIYAVDASNLQIRGPATTVDDVEVPGALLTKLALNNGWAWARSIS